MSGEIKKIRLRISQSQSGLSASLIRPNKEVDVMEQFDEGHKVGTRNEGISKNRGRTKHSGDSSAINKSMRKSRIIEAIGDIQGDMSVRSASKNVEYTSYDPAE